MFPLTPLLCSANVACFLDDAQLASFPVWAMGNAPQLAPADQLNLRGEKLAAVVACLRALAAQVKHRGWVNHWGQMMNHKRPDDAAAAAAAIQQQGPIQPAVFQNMLRNFGAHLRVLAILRLRRRQHPAAGQASPERRARITEHNRILRVLRKECFTFLTKFARHHAVNQVSGHTRTYVLLSQLAHDLLVILISSTYSRLTTTPLLVSPLTSLLVMARATTTTTTRSMNQLVLHGEMDFFVELLEEQVAQLQRAHLDALARGQGGAGTGTGTGSKGGGGGGGGGSGSGEEGGGAGGGRPTSAMVRRVAVEEFADEQVAGGEGSEHGGAAGPNEHAALRDALLGLIHALFDGNAELVNKSLPEALCWRLAHLMQQSPKKQVRRPLATTSTFSSSHSTYSHTAKY